MGKRFLSKIPYCIRGPLRLVYIHIRSYLRSFYTYSTKFIFYLAVKTGHQSDIYNVLNGCVVDYFAQGKHTQEVDQLLNGEKLIHLDVGARGGVLEVVEKHISNFDIIMCEPEREEADKLVASGYKVIKKGLADSDGVLTFYECFLSAGSSVKRPLGPFMHFYNSDPQYLAHYETRRKYPIECATVDSALSELEVTGLDLLKLDTQGSELDILTGLGKYVPLIVVTELQYLPLYHDTPTAYELSAFLFNLGYIPFGLTTQEARTFCPVEGDGFFMPNWEHPEGKKMIKGRMEKYTSLMLIFNQEPILNYAIDRLGLKRIMV